jgi:hypothetical protein
MLVVAARLFVAAVVITGVTVFARLSVFTAFAWLAVI